MRKPLVALVAFVFLAVACGGGDEDKLTLEGATATPGTTKAPKATAKPADAGTGAATAAPGANATAAPQVAPGPAATPKPAAQGGVNPPKDGRYIYKFSGESDDPFNPAAPPEKFDGTYTKQVSHQGNVYTDEVTTSVSPGRVTTRSRWEPDRIVLLSIKIESQGGDFSCTYNPPLLIAKIPVKPEKFPTQQMKGSGNACDGTLDIEILRQEDVKDAKNKTWKTWRVHVQTKVKAGEFNTSQDGTQWFSPELGQEIRSNDTQTFNTAGATQNSETKSTRILETYP